MYVFLVFWDSNSNNEWYSWTRCYNRYLFIIFILHLHNCNLLSIYDSWCKSKMLVVFLSLKRWNDKHQRCIFSSTIL